MMLFWVIYLLRCVGLSWTYFVPQKRTLRNFFASFRIIMKRVVILIDFDTLKTHFIFDGLATITLL